MVLGCLGAGCWWAGSVFSSAAGRFLLGLSATGSSFRLGYIERGGEGEEIGWKEGEV